jgi:hypothetical protein
MVTHDIPHEQISLAAAELRQDTSKEKPKRERRYELDWLRMGAVVLLIAVHTAAIYDPFPLTAVKGPPSQMMKGFAIFVHNWRLAVLFIISGAGAYFALGYLSAGKFSKMRLQRILIPLIVGTLFIVPIQLYYWCLRLYPGRYSSYFQFWTELISNALHGRIWSKPEYLHWGHLWFLVYLFVDSIITLPLFLYLRSEKGRALTARFSSLIAKTCGIFLLGLPLILSELILRPAFPGYLGPSFIGDWANVSGYLLYYIYGFLIYSNEQLRETVQGWAKTALILCIVTTTMYFLFPVFFGPLKPGYNATWMPFLVVRGFNAWFCIITIFAFGMKLLNFNHKILPYATEAVYPVYIVHLPVMTMIAFHVVNWPVPMLLQYFFIVICTAIVSIVVYHVLIRQTSVTRFLFGLKQKKPRAVRT